MQILSMPTLKATALAAALLASLPAGLRAQFPVIGYFPSWSGDAATIPYDKLTHIMYAFAQTDGSGNITIDKQERLVDLLDRAHRNNVKVGLAVGGWNGGNTQPFEAMAANATARANFIKNLVDLCDEGIDGIDMDWEYPNAGSAANYALMMKELGNALKPKGKFLSAAVIAAGDWAGPHVHASVFQSVDFLNLMAYDATHVAHHSSFEVAEGSLDYWVTKRGLPKSKAILGVPFYGRSINGGDQYISYRDVVSANSALAQSDINNGLYYNGIPTIQKKVDLAYQKGGGIMIWEISQDAAGSSSLLTAIHSRKSTLPLGVRIRGRASNAGTLMMTAPGVLRYHAAGSGDYTLRLFGASGAAVPGGIRTTGTGEFRFNNGSVPAGTYLAEITGSGKVHALPILIP